MRRIILTSSERVVVGRHFDVSPSTISDALNFRRNNKKAYSIRNFAMNKMKGYYISL